MDSLLYQKLNKISDLEDRALLKKIMQSVFSSLEDYTIAKYNLIENKVFLELRGIQTLAQDLESRWRILSMHTTMFLICACGRRH